MQVGPFPLRAAHDPAPLRQPERRVPDEEPGRRAGSCRLLGLKYVVSPWVHVVPEWWLAKGSFVGFRCLEHDLECGWPSSFDPAVPDLFRRFYGELARALGDGIDSLCVALTADYGEVGYPT